MYCFCISDIFTCFDEENKKSLFFLLWNYKIKTELKVKHTFVTLLFLSDIAFF